MTEAAGPVVTSHTGGTVTDRADSGPVMTSHTGGTVAGRADSRVEVGKNAEVQNTNGLGPCSAVSWLLMGAQAVRTEGAPVL